jgi:hypothetical protein
MTTPRPPRNRFGTTTFVIVVLGALLAVFPATAVLGLLLLLLALVPAVIAYVLTRTGRATDRRRSLASMVLAPVFLIVAAGVVGANAPVTVNGSPAGVGDASSLAASPTSTPGAAPVVDAPSFDASAVEATGTNRVPQRALAATASTAKATAARSAASKAPVAKAPASKAAVAKSSAPSKAPASKKPSSCDSSTHYVNDSGNCVLRPTAPAAAPSGASAKCKDGTLSFSQHRKGTCSGHGGVAQWLAGAPSS